MRARVMLVLVLTALLVAAVGAFCYLRAQMPEPLADPVGVQELGLPEGHRRLPAGTVWVIAQAEQGPVRVPVPLAIPASWVGRTQSRGEGSVAYWDYVGSSERTQPVFSIAAESEAQWQASQGEPHGEALFSHGGFVWVYSPALDNPYGGSEADEFQRLAGEAYQVAGSLATFFTPGDGAQAARQVLLAYFSALRGGRYAEAARVYGGSYETLIEQNPQIDPQSHAALLEAACTVNGFQCLQVRNARLQEHPAQAGEYRFAVEFSSADGELFVLGPCCGAADTESPPQSEFVFTVARAGEGAYQVRELPVYTP